MPVESSRETAIKVTDLTQEAARQELDQRRQQLTSENPDAYAALMDLATVVTDRFKDSDPSYEVEVGISQAIHRAQQTGVPNVLIVDTLLHEEPNPQEATTDFLFDGWIMQDHPVSLRDTYLLAVAHSGDVNALLFG